MRLNKARPRQAGQIFIVDAIIGKAVNATATLRDQLDTLAACDRWPVRTHLLLLMFVLVLVLYSYYVLLCLVATMGNVIVTGILFLATQLSFGLIGSRLWYRGGAVVRQKLRLLDASTLRGWERIETKIVASDVARIFERILVVLDSSESLPDDLSDLGWFVVVVYSVIATFVAVLRHISAGLCLSVVAVHGSVWVALFVQSYLATRTSERSESIAHLEYVVQSRLSSVSEGAGACPTIMLAVWRRKKNTSVLADFAVRVYSKNDDGAGLLEYCAGLSRDCEECVRILKSVDESPLVSVIASMSISAWAPLSSGEGGFAVCRVGRRILVCDPNSWTPSLSEVDAVSQELTHIVSVILEQLGANCGRHP
ncbi:MAG: hypothetical protein ACTSYX_10445 [Candidatus Thorarchaeota archaeon]